MKRTELLLLLGLFLATAYGFSLRHSVKADHPPLWPVPVHATPDNPRLVALGRKLFYDPILSADSSISCASCHSPFNAFAHSDHALSHGIHDSIGRRNAPALFNLAWQSSFMWDGRFTNPQEQIHFPITHPGEMGETIANVCVKLKRSQEYNILFKKCFGKKQIDEVQLADALSAFTMQLVSDQSKYDAVKSGFAVFTEQEKNGYRLFKMHCNACHTEPLFSNYAYENNGLAIDSQLLDAGRAEISARQADSLRFKVPSLRNTDFTAPYMHDGRINSLRDVLNHYDKLLLRPSNSNKEQFIQLSGAEKTDLLAFLITLNDKKFAFNKQYGPPPYSTSKNR